MLTSDAAESTLYSQISSLLDGLGLKTVEAQDTVHQGTHSMRVVVYRNDREVNTDDLSQAYNIIYPRYSVIFSDRDLELEVSSPGLQRSFKDTVEFSIFTGKLVRVYVNSFSSYVTGTIASSDESSVTLTGCNIEDKGEERESLTVPFSDIAKAKLEYRWEA
ncbi:MAG: ribosome assembly cofactor RimP [Spirochaetes bacterium]|uniref:Ribosome maturation factor RimP n=1 Tax=Candidatus Ornithospirochaeta stercoripullorum TaxID=2840899 RepID=A0A9D9E114_9SPIO|nr:ribosome assembly cofactor RimP [Candidatus Ornithospirochaeta stercoripullorum]